MEEYGDEFSASMGAEYVGDLLQPELGGDRPPAPGAEATGPDTKIKETQSLKVLEAFHKSGIKPEWMILEVLPVLPRSCGPWCRWMAGALQLPI